MRIVTVKDAASKKAFLELGRTLYRDDPEYTPALDIEIENTFNPRKNKSHQHGESIRFLLLDELDRPIGRIGAFYDHRKFGRNPHKVGGVGFFECVDNEVAAHLLFDAARNWLEGKGCEGMDGPVNFGANHMNWGLLVEDFHATSIGMPYSKPYYQRLFEGYGFNVFFKQQSREMDLTRPMPERFAKVTQYAMERHQIIIKPALREELDSLVKDFVLIFNEGWQFHEGFIPLTEREVKEILAELKKIYIEDLFRFAYVNGEAAGFMIALPDLNQIFKPYRGKPGIWGFLKFVIRKRNNYRSYLQSGQLDRIRLLIMGVRPKFQKLGLDAVMSYDARERFYQLGFKRIELSWVGDFNPKMMSLMEATGAHTSCMHHTYRFMFDPALRQTYSMVIPMDTKERYLQEQGQPEETQTESSTDGTTEA